MILYLKVLVAALLFQGVAFDHAEEGVQNHGTLSFPEICSLSAKFQCLSWLVGSGFWPTACFPVKPSKCSTREAACSGNWRGVC